MKNKNNFLYTLSKLKKVTQKNNKNMTMRQKHKNKTNVSKTID